MESAAKSRFEPILSDAASCPNVRFFILIIEDREKFRALVMASNVRSFYPTLSRIWLGSTKSRRFF